METRAEPKVVIVGAGFAGLNAAKALQGKPVQLTVLDKRNHHLFQPLLYQVATAALDPSDIAVPIRSILHGANTDVVLTDVVAVDAPNGKVLLTDGEVPFDYLILACGARDAYFGHEDWPGFAPGLKSIDDALEIRRRVLYAYEEAEQEKDPERKKDWLTFVLIGAGPTGVEMAGALAEISRHALAHDFRHINPADARIVLVENNEHVLPSYGGELSVSARKQLTKLGVEVRTGVRVTHIDGQSVQMGAERINARTVIWAAGVAAAPIGKSLGVPLDKAGRVVVNEHLTIPGHDNIFIVGDLAARQQDGTWVPGVAPAAIQMGTSAAKNILRKVQGKPYEPFVFNDRGTFAVIGRGAAVGLAFHKLKLKGFFAWLAWLSIHVVFLVGFRNRFSVVAKWAYAFVTLRRYARLITGLPRTRAVPKRDYPELPSPSLPLPLAPFAQEVASGSSSLAK